MRHCRTFLPIMWVSLAALGWAWLARTTPAGAAELPASATINDFTGHAQAHSLSCEARAAADWAAFFGVSISEDEFLYTLPTSDNPDVGFVGWADDTWGYSPPNSYGVHAAPVAELLRDYGLPAESQRGLTWDDLRAEIAAGQPVIVWVIGQMWPGTGHEYTAADGETVIVAPFEHVMTLIGYDENYVTAVDAFSGWSANYPISTFLNSWSVLGNMAVIAVEPQPPAVEYTSWLYLPFVRFPPPPEQDASPMPVEDPEPETYTVRPGDYLRSIAEQYGLTWEELAQLNDLTFPFIIYPGQVLKLR